MKHANLKRKNVPLYFQLEQIIKSQIMTGELSAGEQIPTEKELAEKYHVSSITVRQAILNLASEGLLNRRQGRGTFVAENQTFIKNIMTFHLKGDLKTVVPEGIDKQKVDCLDIIKMKAPNRVARILGLGTESEITRVRRTRSNKGAVISYVKNYLPLQIGERLEKGDLQRFTMLHLLRNLGIAIRKGTQYIEAVVADYDVALALAINITTPVLYLETLIIDDKEKPVEFVQTFYRSDKYKYTLNLDLDEIKAA